MCKICKQEGKACKMCSMRDEWNHHCIVCNKDPKTCTCYKRDPNKSFTIKSQKHIVSGCCIYIYSRYKHVKFDLIQFQGRDAVDKALAAYEKQIAEFKSKYTDVVVPMLELTAEQKINHNTARKCHICNKSLYKKAQGCRNKNDAEGKIFWIKDSVRDHSHITGEYRSAAHSICNLNYNLKHFKPSLYLATPHNIRPLELGVDIVIHSATKYLGGHNDLLAGVTLGGHKLLEDLNKLQRMIGSIAGPLSCFLLERGLKTFPLRMEHHNRAGLQVAQALEKHPKVEKVWYPGLPSHPDYAIAKQQMRGFGSVISFLVKGDDSATRQFIDSLELFLITPSLGGSESLVTQMATMSFFDYPAEYRQSIGMVDNLVRLALGLEDPEDLIADLCQALDRI